MSNTAIDWLTLASGFSGVSTQRFFDFGWVLMNSEPPPCALMVCTTLPGVLLVLLRVGADQADGFVAEVAGGPDRAELRMHEVGAAPRVRDLADIDQRGQLVFLGVDHADLVRGVGGDHEVAAGRVEAAVMQEAARR
jgi:hypothetical protein